MSIFTIFEEDINEILYFKNKKNIVEVKHYISCERFKNHIRIDYANINDMILALKPFINSGIKLEIRGLTLILTEGNIVNYTEEYIIDNDFKFYRCD